MNRTREEWKRLDLGDAPDLFTAEDYNGQTHWIMAHAKADIEELHAEIARLRAQVAELVKAGNQVLHVRKHGHGEKAERQAVEALKAVIAAVEGGAND